MQQEWPEEAILAYQRAKAQGCADHPLTKSHLFLQTKPIRSEAAEWNAWKSYLCQKGAVKSYRARRAAWQARLDQAGRRI